MALVKTVVFLYNGGKNNSYHTGGIHDMANPFIHYDVKNGIKYASVYTPRRVGGKKDNAPLYLGRVVDEEKGIYRSRGRGLFAYSLARGFEDITADCVGHVLPREEEKLILDFGDAYLLYSILEDINLYDIVYRLMPGQEDTMMSLIGAKLLAGVSKRWAVDWWEGSYTRILYPKAKLRSQRISEFYAYVILDHARREDEILKYARTNIGSKDVSHEEMDNAIRAKGFCIIISSEKIDTKEILPLYYTRQVIEQVFEVSKNNANLLPLRVHSEEPFRGHLLLSFIATVVFLTINRLLNGTACNTEGAFTVLRNHKCKVFSDRILIKETTKRMNDIYGKLNINPPLCIDLCGKK